VTGRVAAAVAVAAVCAVASGVAGWRAGWFGQGLSQSGIAAPAGGEPDAWSATVVRTFEVNGAALPSVTQFARLGDRTRTEWTEGDRRFVLVVRPDLGLSWTIDLSEGSYIETQIGPNGGPVETEDSDPLTAQQVEAAVAAGLPADGFVARRERIGEESVDGHKCVVYRSRLEALGDATSEATVWEASDFAGLAIRSEIRSGSGQVVRTQLQQLQRDPDPSLFELPAGVRRSGQTP